jgi:endonuclease/exonuclease/phosphatase family metal-dependent hydrolase
MRTAGRLLGTALVVLLIGLVGFFFWASGDRLPDDALAQTTRHASLPAAPDTLTVATYNLGYLSGLTNNEPVVRSESLFTNNMERAVTLLRGADADVVGLQEVDFGAARSFYKHQLDTLAARLNYGATAQAVNWDKRYVPFPYGGPAVHFGRVLSGQGLLSRMPIQAHRRYVLPRPPQPFYRSAFYLDRLAQTALLDWGGRPLLVINVHLEAFHQGTRMDQARAVRALYDRLAVPGLPVLLTGDFNSEWPASTPSAAGTAHHNAADSTLHILLRDTDLRAAYPDSIAHTAPTFPADAPARKIDHIFYTAGAFKQVSQAVRCGAPSPPSDHCAVVTSLTLDATAAPPPPLDSARALLPPAGHLPEN